LLLVLFVGKSHAYYRVLFREKKEKKDITKRKMMMMKRTTKMRKRRRVYNRYVFF
jgi:hypothetical protein